MRLTVPDWLKLLVKRRLSVPTMELRLENLYSAGFRPAKVIDVGAFRGEWSLVCEKYFPRASYLLIEPQLQLAPDLESLCLHKKNFIYHCALLDAESREVQFFSEASNSRIVSNEESSYLRVAPESRQAITLNELARQQGFSSPDMLKIDVQGNELNVLLGAEDLLKFVEVIVLEVSVIQIGPVPGFLKLLSRMQAWGYQLYDIVDPRYRPRDNALWQVDVFFVRSDSELVSSRSWD